MDQIHKYVLTGGSCLIVGLMIGLGASNPNYASSTSDIARAASQAGSHTSKIIDLGNLQSACEDGESRSCDDLKQSCYDILSVGTVNLHKLGKAYIDANIDAFDKACEDERKQAVKKLMEQTRRQLNSDAPSNYQPDPEIVRGMRHSAELNEMLCKTQGINCDAAKLFRKQYEEMVSGL